MDTQPSLRIKDSLIRHGPGAIALGLLIGAGLESFFTFGRALPLALLVTAFLFLICACIRRSAVFMLVCLVVLSLSLGIERFHHEKELRGIAISKLASGPAIVEGRVSEAPDYRENSTKYVVVSDDTRILVTLPDTPDLVYGDHAIFSGKITYPQTFETTGAKLFDYPGYLAKSRIYLEMRNPTYTKEGINDGNQFLSLLYTFKENFSRRISRLFHSPESSLLSGILLGERSGLPDDITEAFIATGTIHIVALSGYNVTIIAESMVKAFQRILGFYLSMFLGAIGIVFFALMTGLGATVVRASIMAIIALIARVKGRDFMMGRALMIAGTLMIIENPWILVYDVSFQLSFLATIGLIYLTPITEPWFMWVTKRLQLREIVAATVATNIMVLPFVLYKMGMISLVSVPINVLIVPVVPIIMLIGFVSVVLSWISFTLALPVVLIGSALLSYILAVVTWSASLPFSHVIVKSISWAIVLGLYVLISMWIMRFSNKNVRE